MLQFWLSAFAVLGGADLGRVADQAPRVSAPQLIETFLTNEARAEEYYVDKEIQVTGKLVRIYRSSMRDGSVVYRMTMDLEKAAKSGLGLELTFDEKSRKDLADLKVNEYVTVRGRCERSSRPVTIELLDCKVVATK